jgi:hypothetical protein
MTAMEAATFQRSAKGEQHSPVEAPPAAIAALIAGSITRATIIARSSTISQPTAVRPRAV